LGERAVDLSVLKPHDATTTHGAMDAMTPINLFVTLVVLVWECWRW